MASDITDVVYVNYLIAATDLAHLVPPQLTLQRLGPDGRYAMFTFLTYRHGHFGPEIVGPLRRLWPSPVQSNWRLYVEEPRTGIRGVLFLSTAITNTPIALVTRLLAEGVPMHVPAAACVERDASGCLQMYLRPGPGSAPDCEAAFVAADTPALEEPWRMCFGDWFEMLAYCVPQDRALTATPGSDTVFRQEIELSIPMSECRPLRGTVDSEAARELVHDATPLCFLVPQCSFRLLGAHVIT